MITASDRLSSSDERRPSRRRATARLLEALENRLLFVTMPVTGTEGNDVITLSVSGGNVVATVNGTPGALPDTIVTDVTINGLGGADTITVHSNGTNSVVINAGAGDDTIQFTPTTQDLDNLDDAVTVNGESGTDTATLFDGNHAGGGAFIFQNGNQIDGRDPIFFTFNTTEVANVEAGGGNDFFSFTAPPALTLNLDGNGGSNTVQVDGGGGAGSMVYKPDAGVANAGVVDLGVFEAHFQRCGSVSASELNNIQLITPNANDVLSVTQQTAINNRISGTSGGVTFAPLSFNTIAQKVFIDTGLSDGAGPATNAVTFTGNLIGAGVFGVEAGLLAGNNVNNLTVFGGTWTIDSNGFSGRRPWNATVTGTGTDVTFVTELFDQLDVNNGAAVHFSGLANDADALAVTAGTGTVDVAAGGRLEVVGGFQIGAGDRLRKTGPGVLFIGSAANHAHGAGSVVDVDAGTFDLNSDAGTATSRTLSIDSNALVRLGSTQHLAGAFADIAGTIRMLPNGSRTLVVTEAAVNGEGGQIDLTDNDMIFDYTGPSQLDNVFHLIRGGFAGGGWNGIGIATSTGAGNPLRALGYAEATDLFTAFPATFSGQSVDSTAVVIKHTFFGDHDLNGNVNLTDFNRLAANFGQTNRRWIHGDNDYNQTINLADFNKLASTFGASGLAPDARAGAAGTRGSVSDEVLDDSRELT